MSALTDIPADSLVRADRFPFWNSTQDEWEEIMAVDLLQSLAEVAGAGLTFYPPGVVVGETPQTDAAYAAIVPTGSNITYRVLKSHRPESLGDWRETIATNSNPGNASVPDQVHAVGWNVGAGSSFQDPTKPGVWCASEYYWQPGSNYKVIEHHQIEGGWPAIDYPQWWPVSARRVLTTELFNVGGFGGYGVPVTVGMDTDVLAVRSNCPDQEPYGSGAVHRNVGADHFTLGHNVANGTTQLRLNCLTTGATHTLLIEQNKDGYTAIYPDNTLYLRSMTGRIYIGPRSEFEGPFTPASSTDAAAPNGTVYYSTTQNKLVFKDPGGVVTPLH